jgi:hypothetical protein
VTDRTLTINHVEAARDAILNNPGLSMESLGQALEDFSNIYT